MYNSRYTVYRLHFTFPLVSRSFTARRVASNAPGFSLCGRTGTSGAYSSLPSIFSLIPRYARRYRTILPDLPRVVVGDEDHSDRPDDRRRWRRDEQRDQRAMVKPEPSRQAGVGASRAPGNRRKQDLFLDGNMAQQPFAECAIRPHVHRRCIRRGRSQQSIEPYVVVCKIVMQRTWHRISMGKHEARTPSGLHGIDSRNPPLLSAGTGNYSSFALIVSHSEYPTSAMKAINPEISPLADSAQAVFIQDITPMWTNGSRNEGKRRRLRRASRPR